MRANLHLKKKKSAGGEWIVEHSPKILSREEKATTITILNFGQNDFGLLRASAATRVLLDGYRRKSQHGNLTLEDKNPRPYDHESDALPLTDIPATKVDNVKYFI